MQAIASQVGFLALMALAAIVAIWATVDQMRLEERKGLRKYRQDRRTRRPDATPHKGP